MTTPEPKPETVLKCARLAYPEFDWRINPTNVLRYQVVSNTASYFNPVTSPADAYQLTLRLMKEGWSFEYSGHIRESFLAGNFSLEVQCENVDFPSLLFQCVEAMENKKYVNVGTVGHIDHGLVTHKAISKTKLLEWVKDAEDVIRDERRNTLPNRTNLQERVHKREVLAELVKEILSGNLDLEEE